MNELNPNKTYKLAILGAGPAGISGAIYAARKEIDTILISEAVGGQSTVSPDIHNWIGDPVISGTELAKKFESHITDYTDKTLTFYKKNIQKIEQMDSCFEISTSDETVRAEFILFTLGSKRRTLEIPGATEYEGRGVVYCASCDGPLFRGKEVAVIGGGNAAFESAVQLAAYCPTVHIINRSNEFRADEITINAAKKNKAIRIHTNVAPTSITGSMFVEHLHIKNTETNEEIVLPVGGIFVEIGQIPNTDYVKNLVSLTKSNTIEIDPWTQSTSNPKIWAAGDCTNILYHQNNIAAGDAIKAIENMYQVINQ